MSQHTDGRATPRRASRSLRGQLAPCLVLLLPACSGAERDVPERDIQSLILITVDTLRADHLGAYGGTVPTPALDALAAESVLLTDMCTQMPSTGPAIACSACSVTSCMSSALAAASRGGSGMM